MNTDLYQSAAYQAIFRYTGWIIEDLGGDQVGYVMRLKFLPLVSVMGIPRAEDPMALSLADQVARQYRSLWFVPRNFLKKVKLRLLSRIIES